MATAAPPMAHTTGKGTGADGKGALAPWKGTGADGKVALAPAAYTSSTEASTESDNNSDNSGAIYLGAQEPAPAAYTSSTEASTSGDNAWEPTYLVESKEAAQWWNQPYRFFWNTTWSVFRHVVMPVEMRLRAQHRLLRRVVNKRLPPPAGRDMRMSVFDYPTEQRLPTILPVTPTRMLPFMRRADLNYLHRAFPPRARDTYVCTYPRSGTLHVQHLVNLLLRIQDAHGDVARLAVRPSDLSHVRGPAPFLEGAFCSFAMRARALGRLEAVGGGRRCFRTHLRPELFPMFSSCAHAKDDEVLMSRRIIYVARDPIAVAGSVWSHAREHPLMLYDAEDLSAFVEHRFCTGKLVYGSWWDHVSDWFEVAQRQARGDVDALRYGRIAFLHHEDVVRDVRGTAFRIARHLDVPLSILNEDVLSLLERELSPHQMARHMSNQCAPDTLWTGALPHFSHVSVGPRRGSALGKQEVARIRALTQQYATRNAAFGLCGSAGEPCAHFA